VEIAMRRKLAWDDMGSMEPVRLAGSQDVLDDLHEFESLINSIDSHVTMYKLDPPASAIVTK
jgi:hypothetical protein